MMTNDAARGAALHPDASPTSTLEQRLLARIDLLEREAVQMRQAMRERELLAQEAARLREANEHLVIAALAAQGLREEAEATNLRQNEFLAMLAHELRNPLAPIGMAGALLARAPNASAQMLQMTSVVKRQVEHMSHLLDDLLDAARISGGKITLSPAPVSLADVLAQAIETVMPRIEERHQSLVVDLPPGPVVLEADGVRLTQVFTNLLANASKYTGDQGAVRLAVAVDGAAATITVADNGTGIGADVLPHIFDLFTQGPRSLARSEGGLGVGLNVVHNLVTMHGGQVHAHSDGIGRGTTFTVELPVLQAGVAPLPAPAPLNGAGAACAVLLIEDNVDACDTLCHLLRLEGHTVATAHNGADGLALALAGDFDVVICDIGLPGLDGYQVLGSLRSAVDGARPYAIALSGYCQADDRARALDAGFDQYLVKPIQPDLLLTVIGSELCQCRRAITK
ncbi:ATP-binding protein [Massilia sp. S19_KUP03_FR1]|uniref:ATP-binding protein n=1 Tax=Massilia sp. S19_KUP03_FR1 TaxID=3025503 RepID=UPI002FCDAEE0